MTSAAPNYLTLHIKGNSTLHMRAERAVMSLQISVEGPSQSTVSYDIHATMAAMRTLLNRYTPKVEGTGAATPDSPITHWSMASLSTNSYYQTDHRTNTPLPPKFTASTSMDVKFRDFTRLGKIASELTRMPHVKISNISWRLTDATKHSLGARSRRAAVEDAVAKAKDFASALSTKTPRAVEVSEQGFTTGTGSHMRKSKAMMITGMGEEDPKTDGMEFEPEDVMLTTNVTVKFVVE